MLSLILVIVGTLIALVGIVLIAPQVRARRIDSGALGAWVIRAGLLVLLVGEGTALFARPELSLVFKVMLISSGAIAFVSLTMLPQEWQQAGFVLQKSLSWQLVWLSLAAYFTAVMFIQPYLMLIGVVGGWLAARYAIRQAAQTEARQVTNVSFGVQAGLLIVTFILLFL